MTTSTLPSSFLWGTASAGHQNEGNNTSSDTWFLEHTTPSLFREPSGSACNSWERWEEDLDLAVAMGLNAHRFSVEWARIEPEPGIYSEEALDHYEAVVDGCLERGLAPIVTFNHFTAPHWFACRGSWLDPGAADAFAAYCSVVAGRFADRLAAAVTLNEPNLEQLLQASGALPPEIQGLKMQMLEAAARHAGVPRYRSANVIPEDELLLFQKALSEAHQAGKAAIKAHRPDLPVGFSIAIADEVALEGGEASRDAKRDAVYTYWLELAREDDFIGVQNYERILHGPDGPVAPGADEPVNGMGTAIEPASLAGAVKYAHQVSRVPVLVTEHGLATHDDSQRSSFIGPAIDLLAEEIAAGTPVLGYCHWTLMDNFEWIFGYGMKLGLHEVNRQTFERTPKDSARALARSVAHYRREVTV